MDANDLKNLPPLLKRLGYTLDAEQPHISGERFLMQKDKWVLAGNDAGGKKVIIKVSRLPGGQAEIRREKNARDLLSYVAFAHEAILFPKELFYGENGEYLFLITDYIEQPSMFVEYTLEEQFFMALRAFEAQEGFNATTFEHLKSIDKVFPIRYARDYFEMFKKFKEVPPRALEFLTSHKQLIDAYSNYLVHTDFVPHNFRVTGKKLYTLDAAAVEFGNKYEGWARFQNYMTIHNPELERLLAQYILKNRGEEDYLNLRLMRTYKIGFIINYYVESLPKTEGDLKQLTEKRIAFWKKVLESVLDDTPLSPDLVEEYKGKRDNLRSNEEKKRLKAIGVS